MIAYSEALNPYLSRPYNNRRSHGEICASACLETSAFLQWLETDDPRWLARMFRAKAQWDAVSARGMDFDV